MGPRGRRLALAYAPFRAGHRLNVRVGSIGGGGEGAGQAKRRHGEENKW
jgi:hypothetical protein